MSPLTVLTGIVMGSAVTIALGLGMVLVVFLILSGSHPRLAAEFGSLIRSFGLFFALALLASYAFIGQVRVRSWRWLAQGSTWLMVVLIAWYYWPR